MIKEEIKQYLQGQGLNEELIREVLAFRERYELDSEVENRVIKPRMFYYGKDILEMAVAAMLYGENLLLSGAKATGKNVLCETLAYIFGRPAYNISFHVNTDSSTLIGTDTFKNNEVVLRKGSVYNCAQYGGFAVFDEINMAKNDAVSVLHATLDHRRIIDVPGYDKIDVHPAARFIGTMNYGYAGTKALNEALVSRFLVIDMPPLSQETILFLLKRHFENASDTALEQFAGLFVDLQTKVTNGEISSKALDLRGLISAISICRSGISPVTAVCMGVTNKSFDLFEKEIIEDTVMTRIPKSWTREDIFS